jgi:nicotinamide-nucleotide amidase
MDTQLLHTLNTLLSQRQLKIAVAESLTCGLLQQALGAVSGSSLFFEGGITAYSLQQKVHLLQVDAEHASLVNCVSQQVAYEMAAGACRVFDCDLALATTGYAEPCPAQGITEPMAFFALSRRQDGKIQTIAGKQLFGGKLDRAGMQTLVCQQALLALLDYLQSTAT